MTRRLQPAVGASTDGVFPHASTACGTLDVRCPRLPMDRICKGAEPEALHGGPADVQLCTGQTGTGLQRAEGLKRKIASLQRDSAGRIRFAGCRHG